MRNAKVTWGEISGYNPSSLEEQTIEINGTIELPEDVLNGNNLPLTTSVRVIVQRADITEKPIFESLVGEYDYEFVARILSEENSTTYYTISSNGAAPADPTENSEIYTGGIELLQSDEKDIKYIIKAMSVKDGKFNSAVSTQTYTILKTPTEKLTVSDVEDQTYTGNEITPKIVVKDGDTILTEGTDYTVEYENNVDIGTATIKIIGKGNYEGESVTKTFNIVTKEDVITPKDNPKTGDDIDFWFNLQLISISGFILTKFKFKKKRIVSKH